MMRWMLAVLGAGLVIACVVHGQSYIGDTVTPMSPTYPVTSFRYHLGGWHSGTSTTAVAAYLLQPGMAYYDVVAGKLWVLNAATNWVEFAPAAAADPRIVIQESGSTSIVYVVHSDGHTNKIGSFISNQ